MAEQLPESAYGRCCVCDGPVRGSARLLYEIVGYERERNAGGTNHVIARARTGRVVGACCAEAVKRGDVGQAVIF